MEDDIKALREEVTKLRERVAVLEAGRSPMNIVDWAPLVRVGSPHFVTAAPFPPGTITGTAC